MKSFTILTAFCVLFVGQEIHAFSPNCFSQMNGYLIANPSSSNKYYVCHGNIPIPMECSQGLVFCSTDIIKACMDACPYIDMPNSGPMYPAPGQSPTYNNPPSQPWQPQIPIAPPEGGNNPMYPYPGQSPSYNNPPSQPWQPQIPVEPPVNPSNPNWIPTPEPSNPVWIPTAAPNNPAWVPTAAPNNPAWVPTAAPNNPPWVPTAATASPNEIPTAPTEAPIDSSECINRANGILFPMPNSCSGYIMCVNGKAQPGSCLGNKVFDATSGTCSQNVCQ